MHKNVNLAEANNRVKDKGKKHNSNKSLLEFFLTK